MKKSDSKNVVFVAGAFVHNSTWDEWKTYFEGKGYNVVAPAWPFNHRREFGIWDFEFGILNRFLFGIWGFEFGIVNRF